MTRSLANLQARLHGYGLGRVLGEACEIAPGEPLFEMVVARYRAMAAHRAH